MATHRKHLVVNVIIDNSILTSEYQLDSEIQSLTKDLEQFNQETFKYSLPLRLAIYSFDGLNIKTVKDYDSANIQDLPKNGFPMMNRMLHKVTKKTETYIHQEIETKGYDYFKPWLVILSSGMGLDKNDFFETYRPLKPQMQPVIFPFLMSKNLLMYDLTKINQIKPFIPLKNFNITAFGEWLKSMIKQRLTIDPNESMRLSKTMFQGWTQL